MVDLGIDELENLGIEAFGERKVMRFRFFEHLHESLAVRFGLVVLIGLRSTEVMKPIGEFVVQYRDEQPIGKNELETRKIFVVGTVFHEAAPYFRGRSQRRPPEERRSEVRNVGHGVLKREQRLFPCPKVVFLPFFREHFHGFDDGLRERNHERNLF